MVTDVKTTRLSLKSLIMNHIFTRWNACSMQEQLKPHSNCNDARYMLQLAACVFLCNSVWHWLCSLRNTSSVWVCVSVSVFAHMCLFSFNICVTLGTAQLKSNTLQESITRWVYWQGTELKWPTEKGREVLFEEHCNKMMENMITEVFTARKCEHPLDALTGSYCENCCQFSFTDI